MVASFGEFESEKNESECILRGGLIIPEKDL